MNIGVPIDAANGEDGGCDGDCDTYDIDRGEGDESDGGLSDVNDALGRYDHEDLRSKDCYTCK